MLVHAAPGTLLWPAAMIVWGPGERSSGHAHHCVQLVMALQGRLQVREGCAEEWRQCGGVIIRADARHEIDARGIPVLIGFVAPESALGSAMMARTEREITVIADAEVARWRNELGAPPTPDAVESWIRVEMLHHGATPALHPGVRRVLGYLRDRLGRSERFPLAELARVAGLSPSRLMHVFTESVGVPLRPYVLWLRLQFACGELLQGRSVTESAHAAGFSDSAHMTRTFRRMLGTTPSELAARSSGTGAAAVKSD